MRCADASVATISFEQQLKSIERDLVSKSTLPILARYEDIGTTNNNGWSQLLEAAQLKKFSHVAISSMDSLSCTVMDAQIRIVSLQVVGVTLKAANNSHPELLLALNRYYAGEISKRIRAGLEFKKNRANKS